MKSTRQLDPPVRLAVGVTTIVLMAVSTMLAFPGVAGALGGTSKHQGVATASSRFTASPLAGAVPGPLTVEKDQFVDADGRVVFLHGLG